MAKLLIWIGVVVVVLLGLRLLNVAKASRHGESAHRATPPAESMVRCVRCGVFLPTAEAKPGPDGMTCGEPGCGQRPRGGS
jgi:hypothetical protein